MGAPQSELWAVRWEVIYRLGYRTEKGRYILPGDLATSRPRRVGVYRDGPERREPESVGALRNAEHGADRTENWVGSTFAISDGLVIVIVLLSPVKKFAIPHPVQS